MLLTKFQVQTKVNIDLKRDKRVNDKNMLQILEYIASTTYCKTRTIINKEKKPKF